MTCKAMMQLLAVSIVAGASLGARGQEMVAAGEHNAWTNKSTLAWLATTDDSSTAEVLLDSMLPRIEELLSNEQLGDFFRLGTAKEKGQYLLKEIGTKVWPRKIAVRDTERFPFLRPKEEAYVVDFRLSTPAVDFATSDSVSIDLMLSVGVNDILGEASIDIDVEKGVICIVPFTRKQLANADTSVLLQDGIRIARVRFGGLAPGGYRILIQRGTAATLPRVLTFADVVVR